MQPAAQTRAWRVQVKGQSYGPYSDAQMRAFVAEGRVTARSLVAHGDGDWREAGGVAALAGALLDRAQPKPAEQPVRAPGEANLVVYADIVTGAHAAFVAGLSEHGKVMPMTSQLYLLRTRHSAAKVRNALSQRIDTLDRFLVVDATHDRLAWFNMGPETDSRVRETWNAPLAAND